MPLISGAVPMGVPLSRKVTVPVGVPLKGNTALTVAVKKTVWPNTDGLGKELIVVLLLLTLLGMTTCVTMFDVLPAKVASPPKTAVIRWLPGPRAAVVNGAVPLVSGA